MSGEQADPPQSSAAKSDRRQLFISYSHRDGEWVNRLLRHLRPLERRYALERWDDSRIQAGMPWRDEIRTALARAQVALLMVSADFLDSDFVTREELPPLFHAAKEEGLRILWVPLGPCLWKHHPEIERYQAVIPPGRTVAEMAEVEQERAFVQIAEQILSTFQEEAERRAAQKKAEEEHLARQKDALERHAERERLEREQEDERRQTREREERLAREEQQRQRVEAEREAHGRETAAESTPPIPAPWPESSGPALPEGAERSRFGPLETATLGRVGSTWEIQRHSIETWGFRERLGPGVELKMMAIPAGSFLMGSPADEPERIGAEGPRHEVRLEGFFLLISNEAPQGLDARPPPP